MSERSWEILTAGGLCHLVVADTPLGDTTPAEDRAADLRTLLDLQVTDGDYAIDPGDSQTCVAFTSFGDAERFAAVLRDVRPVRQIETRWSSQWDGIYDKPAVVRLRGELRRKRRSMKGAAAPVPSAPVLHLRVPATDIP